MLTDPLFTLPPPISYHREATPCRLHFPGWLLAGFSQWGHWVGNWRRAGEDRGGGAGSRQGSSPRNLCGGLHGLDSRFPGFTERSQSLGLSTPLWKWFLTAANLWGASISHLASQRHQDALHLIPCFKYSALFVAFPGP